MLHAVAKAFGVSIDELVPTTSTSKIVGQPEKLVSCNITGADTARVKIDMELPVDTALAVLKLIRESEKH